MGQTPLATNVGPVESEPRRPKRASVGRSPGSADRTSAAPPAQGPRIYNLFPLLAGPIGAWHEHLGRISRMGFNWVYVNAFHEAGASGSLYATTDPTRLDPRIRGAESRSDDELVQAFTADAARHGLGVMTDLNIGSLAKDSPLVDAHPDWFQNSADGALASPRLADAGEARQAVTWPDLVALDYGNTAARRSIIDYWLGRLEHQLSLGMRGFVAKTAQLVPVEVWRALLSAGRVDRRGLLFVADALGSPPEQIEGLAPARFDYVFNSARWWDFRSDWLLDQRRRLRHVAPSIAFPESHDSGRLAASKDESPVPPGLLHLHVLFSAFFSSGWMLPIGCEYGFRRELNPSSTSPDDWEDSQLDLTGFIAALNAARQNHHVLNTEGAVQRLSAPDAPLICLLRLSDGHVLRSPDAVLFLINPDRRRAHTLRAEDIYPELGGRFDQFIDITPQRTPVDFAPDSILALDPLEIRALCARRADGAAQRSSARLRPPPRPSPEDRITIEAVTPEIDGGRYPAKRIVGDQLEVAADIFMDGHDQIAACVRYKAIDEGEWREVRMVPQENDRWRATVPLARNTQYLYTIEAWRDSYESWRSEFIKRRAAGQNLELALQEGRRILGTAVRAAAARGEPPSDPATFALDIDADAQAENLLLAEDVRAFMRGASPREFSTRYPRELSVVVDRLAARYSAWYELFPRSQSGDIRRHGTFDDVAARLPYVRDLGFDVLYFTPIHPIGQTNRKGRNNSLAAGAGDPGSPYAIGSAAGGHDAVHPELGTIEDFRRLVATAHDHGLEIALDIAVQCSLDHPWLREHPEWFERRPDGTIKHAENPPKKYEDIVNPIFYGPGFPGVWHAVRDVIRYWIDQGVAIFRVDNPHTKPVPFWEWLIAEIRRSNPEVVFLSEAFTRPKMMRKLAKAGFSQSYTYFTWRNNKSELTEYLTELSQGDSSEYFRPNFFANTPDINPLILQTGGRAAFMMRAVLAATLSSSYGIYSGFELCEGTPLPNREEYLDSEKYEIKAWDWNRPGNIRDYIARLNAIRRANPALHDFRNLRFYNSDDSHVLVYGKKTAALDNFILVAVNLDPHNVRESRFELPLWEFGLPDWAGLHVVDLLGGASLWWQGKFQHLRLDPAIGPAGIWRLTRPLGERTA